MQTNWIGRSEGAEVVFTTAPADHHAGGEELRVFTTRPDTLFGATFMVLAPEHPLVDDADGARPPGRGRGVRRARRRQTEIERLSTDREKTGVRIGADAINPVNGERIPIWIADYVLGGYGTGAIMAVPGPRRARLRVRAAVRPAHPRVVIAPGAPPPRPSCEAAYVAHTDDEVLVNAGQFSGLPADEGARRIVGRLAEHGQGHDGGDLPHPRLAGQPPALLGHAHPGRLLRAPAASCRCPRTSCRCCCPTTSTTRRGRATRSSHDEAFLNDDLPAVRRAGPARDGHHGHVHGLVVVLVALPVAAQGRRRRSTATWSRRWCPVDQYTGGAEHAVMHLLYSRFFTKALRDLGMVQRARAIQAAVQPGPDPGRRRRADEQEPRQRPGPRRAGRALRRRHGAPVPDVHGPVGPGRPVEPDGIERRQSIPATACGRWCSTRTDASRATRRRPTAGRRESRARCRHLRAGGPSDAARGHRGPRRVPLEHDGRQAHGADQRADALPRHRGRRAAGVGRGDPAAAADAGADAPHISEELWSRLRGSCAGRRGARSTPRLAGVLDGAGGRGDASSCPIQVNGKLRDLVTMPLASSRGRDRSRSCWRATRSSPRWAQAAAPDHPRRRRRLVNIVL